MQDTALFTQLLGLGSPWKVTEITPDLDGKSITIRIEWPKGEKGPCPECNSPCQVYDHREERTWRHLDTMKLGNPKKPLNFLTKIQKKQTKNNNNLMHV